MNEQDAGQLSLLEGQRVRVSSPSGSFVAPVKLSDKVRRGMVCIPTNFPDLGVYRLFQENTTMCRVKVSACEPGVPDR